MSDARKTISEGASPPARFYDNRQNYLMFVTTCNEKSMVVARLGEELHRLRPTPPCLRLFDAGIGDGRVMNGMLRQIHARFPHVPIRAVGKEISLEDVRLFMDKIPDRLTEHPDTIFVITNLPFKHAVDLGERREDVTWQHLALEGNTSHELERQLHDFHDRLAELWRVDIDAATGNPRPATPAVLVIYREDRAFALDRVIPRRGQSEDQYDLAMAIQPYRARLPLDKKINWVLGPLAEHLAPNGLMIGVQSSGQDPAMQIVRAIWPAEDPFTTPAPQLQHGLLAYLADKTPERRFSTPDTDAMNQVFRYRLHSMPDAPADMIGTSTLVAAWNAAVYVAQIDGDRVLTAERDPAMDYLEETRRIIDRFHGLWFTNEMFMLQRGDE